MQFCFVPVRGTIDTVFILRRLQEEHNAKEKKMYVCFVDIEKAIDRTRRNVLGRAIWKKGIL